LFNFIRWNTKDVYKNNRRPGLPADLTITGFAEMHYQVAKNVILDNGGKVIDKDGKPGFLIALSDMTDTSIKLLPPGPDPCLAAQSWF